MANQGFLRLDGIEGPAVQKDPERLGFIPLLAFTHDVSSDLDPQTGPVTKERRHRGMTVTKNVDFTTPRLHEALANGREFASGRINFFHMPRSGDEKNYYRIDLTKPRIAAIRTVMPSLFDPSYSESHEYEEVDLVYESLAFTHTSPSAKTLEEGAYTGSTFKDVQAPFAPDWIEEEAKALTMLMLQAATAEAKARIKAEIEAQKKK